MEFNKEETKPIVIYKWDWAYLKSGMIKDESFRDRIHQLVLKEIRTERRKNENVDSKE